MEGENDPDTGRHTLYKDILTYQRISQAQVCLRCCPWEGLGSQQSSWGPVATPRD